MVLLTRLSGWPGAASKTCVALVIGLLLGATQAQAQDTLKFNILAPHAFSITGMSLYYLDGRGQSAWEVEQATFMRKIKRSCDFMQLNERQNRAAYDSLLPGYVGSGGSALLITTKQNKRKPAVVAFNQQIIQRANYLGFSAGHWNLVSQTLSTARYYLDNKPVTRQQAEQAIKISSLMLLKGPEAAKYAHDPAAATTGVVRLTTKQLPAASR